MREIFLDTRKAALIRQDEAARSLVPLTGQNRKDALIMAYLAQAPVSFSDVERAQIADLTEGLYRKALAIVQDANELREAAGLPFPEGVFDLDAYRSRRMGLTR